MSLRFGERNLSCFGEISFDLQTAYQKALNKMIT